MRKQRIKPVDKKYGSWEDEARWVVKCNFCGGGPILKGWGWARPEGDGVECCKCAGCPNTRGECPGCAHIKEAAENGAEKQD